MKYGGQYGCEKEEQNEKRKYFCDLKGISGAALFFFCAVKCQEQSDWYNRQGSGQLNNGGSLQRVASVETVPCGSGGCDGGGVIDGRTGKQPEAFVGKPQSGAERGEK